MVSSRRAQALARFAIDPSGGWCWLLTLGNGTAAFFQNFFQNIFAEPFSGTFFQTFFWNLFPESFSGTFFWNLFRDLFIFVFLSRIEGVAPTQLNQSATAVLRLSRHGNQRSENASRHTTRNQKREHDEHQEPCKDDIDGALQVCCQPSPVVVAHSRVEVHAVLPLLHPRFEDRNCVVVVCVKPLNFVRHGAMLYLVGLLRILESTT